MRWLKLVACRGAYRRSQWLDMTLPNAGHWGKSGLIDAQTVLYAF